MELLLLFFLNSENRFSKAQKDVAMQNKEDKLVGEKNDISSC